MKPLSRIVITGVLLIGVGSARGDQTEIVTYYSAPTTDVKELRADKATIGNAYRSVSLADKPDGTLLISGRVGIGTSAVMGVGYGTQLKVEDTLGQLNGSAISGLHPTGVGVLGVGDLGNTGGVAIGVQGQGGNFGVQGTGGWGGPGGVGVEGTGGVVGVRGINVAAGVGVRGQSVSGTGVEAVSTSGNALQATSTNNTAVVATAPGTGLQSTMIVTSTNSRARGGGTAIQARSNSIAIWARNYVAVESDSSGLSAQCLTPNAGYAALIGRQGTWAVYGYTTEPGSYGGYFDGASYGVYARSLRGSYGGFFAGGTYGVYASGSSYSGYFSGGANAGVYGAGATYGVEGRSSRGTGVYGSSSAGLGVVGQGSTYGVAGTGPRAGVSGSGGNTGVYASGGRMGVEAYGGSGVVGYGTDNTGAGVQGVALNGMARGVSGVGGRIGVEGAGSSFDFYASGAGEDFASASSIQWKRDVTPLNNALEKVMQLRGVEFTWDPAHGGTRDLGLIAEEVSEVLPEFVGRDADGRPIAIDYGKLTSVLVEAVKAQQREIEALKTEVEALKRGQP